MHSVAISQHQCDASTNMSYRIFWCEVYEQRSVLRISYQGESFSGKVHSGIATSFYLLIKGKSLLCIVRAYVRHTFSFYLFELYHSFIEKSTVRFVIFIFRKFLCEYLVKAAICK